MKVEEITGTISHAIFEFSVVGFVAGALLTASGTGSVAFNFINTLVSGAQSALNQIWSPVVIIAFIALLYYFYNKAQSGTRGK